MPQRFLLVLVVISMAVAACHGSAANPTASSTPFSPSPNPSITKATVEVVTANGTPIPRIPVEESTPRNKESPRPGTPFDTEITGKQGLARFHNLKPSVTYCWVAVISTKTKSSECAGWSVWQSGDIVLGN